MKDGTLISLQCTYVEAESYWRRCKAVDSDWLTLPAVAYIWFLIDEWFNYYAIIIGLPPCWLSVYFVSLSYITFWACATDLAHKNLAELVSYTKFYPIFYIYSFLTNYWQGNKLKMILAHSWKYVVCPWSFSSKMADCAEVLHIECVRGLPPSRFVFAWRNRNVWRNISCFVVIFVTFVIWNLSWGQM